MRALVYHGREDLRLEDRAVPEPGPGEVLLRVRAVGMCGSDEKEYSSGPHLVPGKDGRAAVPIVLGHEFAGEVVDAGEGVSGLAAGALVSCGAGVSCGTCLNCRLGKTNLCQVYATHGFHRDGGLAEFCAVPAAICADAGSKGLAPDTAALAQPMAIAVHTLSRGAPRTGDTLVIAGAGGIGSFVTYAALAAGMRVIVADIRADRLELAARMGVAATIDVSGEPLRDALVRMRIETRLFYEVTGTPAGLDSVLSAAEPGTTVVVTGVQRTPQLCDYGRVTLSELTLVGTQAHVCSRDLPQAIDYLAARREGWADIAPRVLPMESVATDVLEAIGRGQAPSVKTLVDPAATGPRDARHDTGGVTHATPRR
ncbi:MAG: (R,R)-butanediol dehydrogenase / meso-butanediol dehydrogenase / diacetyl reductase [Streptosporangiaceae bacterium]|nr:(R,R)-butanediol dehydrogenase / meso-butanediol dehydrogenase / diacetyl reductase [Streptosporangiaceae bacterium]